MTGPLILYLHFGIDKSQNMRPKRMKLYIMYENSGSGSSKILGPPGRYRSGTLGTLGTLHKFRRGPKLGPLGPKSMAYSRKKKSSLILNEETGPCHLNQID